MEMERKCVQEMLILTANADKGDAPHDAPYPPDDYERGEHLQKRGQHVVEEGRATVLVLRFTATQHC